MKKHTPHDNYPTGYAESTYENGRSYAMSVCLIIQEQHGVINPFFVDFTICSL